VDAKQCAACHAAIYQTYRRTGMAQSFYRPRPDNTPVATFFHKASATSYSILEREGRFYQRRWQTGYQGKEENVDELSIDYVMGSGNHVRTYLHRTTRGPLIELPLAWYAEKGGSWAMNPGYDTAAPDTRRKVGYDCMFCHNSYPEIPAGHDAIGSEAAFSGNLPEGIDCQRCHGPGSEHVRVAQTPNVSKETIRTTILNPAHLSTDRQMEVCMQCHLETTSRRLPNMIRRFDRGPYSYRPDEPLGNLMIYFDNAPGTGREGKFEIVNSAYRLRQSRCFVASSGKLTCQRCHNPHDVPRGDAAVKHYSQICRDCHSSTFDAKIAANLHTRDANCIACHMPKRRTEDVVHAVMTDHLIQRRKPAGDLLAAIPEHNDTEATSYHGEVVPYYPLNRNEDDALYVAVAQVSQKSNLAAGLPRLAEAIERRKPTQIEFYIALGDAWRDSGEHQKSLGPYEEAVKRDAKSVVALKRLAIALKEAGQFSRTGETLQRALQLAPDDASLWFELGSLDSDQRRYAQAIGELEKTTSLDPDMAEAYQNLGVALAESGKPDRAQTAFQNALRIRPYAARTHANLAKLLSSRDDVQQALYHFEKAVALRSDDALARFDFGVLLARLNRMEEAQRQMEAAVKNNPRLAEAHDLLGSMLEMKGKIAAAQHEYEEAVRIKPEFARARLNLGALLAGKGDRTGAIHNLQLAVQSAAKSNDMEISEQAHRALQELSVNR